MAEQDPSLDDILDSALEDFDDSQPVEDQQEQQQNSVQEGVKAGEELADGMAKLMQEFSDGDFNKVLEETFKSLGGDTVNLPQILEDLSATADAKPASSQSKAHGLAPSDNLKKTLEELVDSARKLEGMDEENSEDIGDAMMEKLVEQMEGMGNSGEFQNLMEGMMQQFMSKDIMYQPISQMYERYPIWLRDNRHQLSDEEFARYNNQMTICGQICKVYDMSNGDTEKIMDLMNQLQECGQPPEEIVKEIAPGLELDSDGIPQFPGLEGVDNGKCNIM